MEGLLHKTSPGHLQLQLFQEMGIVHAFSTREGGVSQPPYHTLNLGFGTGDDPRAVRINYYRFLEALGVDPSSLIRVRQAHGDRVLVLQGKPGRGESLVYDAMVTNRPGLTLTIGSADCLSILLFDPKRGAIGAVHAGWRSTVKRIAEKTVKTMVRAYGTDPQELFAAIGPGIGPCCYEVDRPVIEALKQALPSWEAFTLSKENGRFHLDLQGVNRRILEEAGLSSERIFSLPFCTACRRDLFYSYRAEGSRTGRMLSLIRLP